MLDALLTVTRAMAIPYGYTVAIWSAGMLAVARYGVPRQRHVLSFVLGATLGYLLLDVPNLLFARGETMIPLAVPASALLNVLPAFPAVLTAVLVRQIRSTFAGFFVLGLTSTLAYILALSLLIVIVHLA